MTNSYKNIQRVVRDVTKAANDETCRVLTATELLKKVLILKDVAEISSVSYYRKVEAVVIIYDCVNELVINQILI
jgi:hypothetical protein